MPIQARTNLYPGVNAHLNSFLQQPDGGWESFHAAHLNALTQALDAVLPENYYAIQEKSLQIGVLDFPTERARHIPDVTVYQQAPARERPRASVITEPTDVLQLTETLLTVDQHDLLSVLIYHVIDGKAPGVPVTRIELLSPSNKPPHDAHKHYIAKRREGLYSGVALIEIDLLHETAPVLPQITSYRAGEAGAFPFMVLISKPYPDIEHGEVEFYGVEVLHPLPTIAVPLAHGDTIALDLNAVYHDTFAAQRIWGILVDYAADPVNMQRYSAADHTRIGAFLTDIRQRQAR